MTLMRPDLLSCTDLVSGLMRSMGVCTIKVDVGEGRTATTLMPHSDHMGCLGSPMRTGRNMQRSVMLCLKSTKSCCGQCHLFTIVRFRGLQDVLSVSMLALPLTNLRSPRSTH